LTLQPVFPLKTTFQERGPYTVHASFPHLASSYTAPCRAGSTQNNKSEEQPKWRKLLGVFSKFTV